ncbi:MAG: hypothetical protein JXM70_17700 [Pirellulales bacterium]|nr:hypothetical protein [Pirellulales bacterium]
MKIATTVCVLALLFGAGCGKHGDNRGAVSGQITLDGQPLQQGSILFVPVKGTKGVVTGGEIKDGQYHLSGNDGPAVGQNRVEIRAVRKTGRMVPKPMAPAGEMVEETGEAIPARFNSQSTIEAEIKPGDNTANFELTSK